MIFETLLWTSLTKFGAAMAQLSQGGITLPVWFLSLVLAGFLAATSSVVGIALNTSKVVAVMQTNVDNNTAKLKEEDARIGRLEDTLPSIAVMQSDISELKTMAEHMDNKIDKLSERQWTRRP